MPGQPKDLFDAMREHHLPRMKEQHRRLLVMLASGRSREEIGRALDASPATVQRWIDLATAEIVCSSQGPTLTEAHGQYPS